MRYWNWHVGARITATLQEKHHAWQEARRSTPPRQTASLRKAPPLWARLPADRRRELSDLLGQLLARLHAARSAGEVSHD